MKHIYTQPQSVIQAAQTLHTLCGSDSVKSTGVNNVTENGIWGNSPSRRPVIH